MNEALLESDDGNLRCIFISQDDGGIGRLLLGMPVISMTADFTKPDIQAYAAVWSKRIQGSLNCPMIGEISLLLL